MFLEEENAYAKLCASKHDALKKHSIVQFNSQNFRIGK